MDIKTDRINVVYVIGKFGIGGIETLKLCMHFGFRKS